MKKILVLFFLLFIVAACDQQEKAADDSPVAEVEPALDKVPGGKVSEEKTSEDKVAASQSNNKQGASDQARSGQVIYDLHCAGCHEPGEGHAGTMKLALLHGEEKAVLLQRSDLNADYIKQIVREGMLEMAPFRPTDINDAELDNLTAMIVATAQKGKQ